MQKIKVGEKVARLRREHNLTQRDLAERAGITHGAVSSIENNKVSPSISSLHKIVTAFSMSLSVFFQTDTENRPLKVVIGENELVEIGNQSVSMKQVCDGRRNRQLGFLIELYQPGGSTGPKTITHEGEEAGTVLEGEIELTIDGQTYTVRTGESFVYDTSIPHSMKNSGTVPCRIISAHTPASF